MKIFKKSKLDRKSLGKIWELVATEGEGELKYAQFEVAMHLVSLKVNGKDNYQLPSKLPTVVRKADASPSATAPSSANSTAASAKPPTTTASPKHAAPPPKKKTSPQNPATAAAPSAPATAATPTPAAAAEAGVAEENHYDMLAPGETATQPASASASASASAGDVADAKRAIEEQKAVNSALEDEQAHESETLDQHSAELQILRAELKGLKRAETELRLSIKTKKASLVEVLADIRKAKSDRTKLHGKSAKLQTMADKAEAGLQSQIEKRSQLQNEALGATNAGDQAAMAGMSFGDYFGNT